MKLACSSSAFDALFRSGDLTQLEWIDLCAHQLTADGVVFDTRHFPRIDSDYLAQLKKMCVDKGLTIAALRDDAFFSGNPGQMERAAQIALELGSPLIAAPLQKETAATWSATLERLAAAASLAKRTNITLALRNAPDTFASGTHEMKRVSKEADSAWLRYGPDFSLFDAAGEPQALLPKVVLVWQQVRDANSYAELLARYRGFIALDDDEGRADAAQVERAVQTLRGREMVNRA